MWEPFGTSSTRHTWKEMPGRSRGGPAAVAPVRQLSQVHRWGRPVGAISQAPLPSGPIFLQLLHESLLWKADGLILDSRVRPSSASDVLEALGHVTCQVARWQVVRWQVARSLVVSVAAGPWELPISHAPTRGSSGWAGGLTALGARMI